MCSLHVPRCSYSMSTMQEFKYSFFTALTLWALHCCSKSTLNYQNLPLPDERSDPFPPPRLLISAPRLSNHWAGPGLSGFTVNRTGEALQVKLTCPKSCLGTAPVNQVDQVNNLIWLTLLSTVDMVISRGALVGLIIESGRYGRANAKAQLLAPVTAVCTRVITGAKGTRGAIFWASAPGNAVHWRRGARDADTRTMLPACSMNDTCHTGSTRVTSLTFIQVLLSCTGGRRSWALAFPSSSIITRSPAAILGGAASLLPSTPPAH